MATVVSLRAQLEPALSDAVAACLAAHGFVARKGRVVRRLPGVTQTILHSASYFHGTAASVQPQLRIEFPAIADLLHRSDLGRAAPGVSQPITFPAGTSAQGWMVYAADQIEPVIGELLPVLEGRTLPLCDDITDLDALVRAFTQDDPRILFLDAGIAAVMAGLLRQGRRDEARALAVVRGRGVDVVCREWPALGAELL